MFVYIFFRSSRCRHLHPTDIERLNYTLSAYFENQGETRMALKSAGFLAAIERGAHFIFQANPGKILILIMDRLNRQKI